MQNAIKYAHQNFFTCVLNRFHSVGFAGDGSASSTSELAEVSDFDMVVSEWMRARKSAICNNPDHGWR